jgi:hypothetical protein
MLREHMRRLTIKSMVPRVLVVQRTVLPQHGAHLLLQLA